MNSQIKSALGALLRSNEEYDQSVSSPIFVVLGSVVYDSIDQ